MTDIDPSEADDIDEYQSMLEQLDVAIDEVNRKIENGRIRDAEKDQTRIKFYRALGYLIRSRLKVIEQRDLQELEERIAELEDRENGEAGITL